VQRDAALLSREHDVTVVHLVEPRLLGPDDAMQEHSDGVRIERVAWSRTSLSGVRSLRRRIRALLAESDVLHTHAFQALLPLTGLRIPVPWVHSEHWSGIGDPRSLTRRGRAVLRATGRLLNRPDIVTAVSSLLAERVRDHRHRRPVMIVPSVVEPPERIVPFPPSDSDVRLVAVANLVDGKDPFLALAAVRELRARGMRPSLTWVGAGPLAGPLETELTQDDDVFLMGALDASGVAQALDDAHLFLLPTRGETLCLAALEALSHGRPVVIGANGGQRDYIVEANGRLVTERTAAAYADAVQDILAADLDPASVAATISDRYSPEAVAAGYLAAYADARHSRALPPVQ
jgi:glycosyltransferase involved in cell wall biosynthesis